VLNPQDTSLAVCGTSRSCRCLRSCSGAVTSVVQWCCDVGHAGQKHGGVGWVAQGETSLGWKLAVVGRRVQLPGVLAGTSLGAKPHPGQSTAGTSAKLLVAGPRCREMPGGVRRAEPGAQKAAVLSDLRPFAELCRAPASLASGWSVSVMPPPKPDRVCRKGAASPRQPPRRGFVPKQVVLPLQHANASVPPRRAPGGGGSPGTTAQFAPRLPPLCRAGRGPPGSVPPAPGLGSVGVLGAGRARAALLQRCTFLVGLFRDETPRL